MSGLIQNLGVELLICWDEINHCFRELLNCHNQSDDHYPASKHNKPTIVVEEYSVNKDLTMASTASEDDYPHMAEPEDYYTKSIRYTYTEDEEEQRKY